MKNLLSIIFLLIFSCQLSFAQEVSKSKSKTVSCSSSSQEIHIDIDSNQKMALRIDDEEFKMKIRFEKKHDLEIEDLISKHLQVSDGSNKKASDIEFSFKSGKLETHAVLEDLSENDRENLSLFTKELFSILDWDVDVNGL